MVKHGRNKKRRAGRIGRTKLKNKNFSRWDPKPKITDDTVKQLWDTTKTPAQNLAHMGLSSNFNETVAGTGNDTANNNVNVIALFDVPESDTHNSKKNKLPLTAEEQEYIVKGLSKYGTDNYKALFRDIKTNKLQHTEDKLAKMGARFLLLNPNQLLVDPQEIPDKLLAKMEHGDEIKELAEEQDTNNVSKLVNHSRLISKK